jgi:hypothetical protein
MPAGSHGRRRILIPLVVGVVALALNYAPVAYGSIFGEENVTLVKMLTELMHANHELESLSDTASQVADMTHDVLSTYRRVHSGVEELEHYDADQFLYDFRNDAYHQYPGFAKLEYASRDLQRWEDTHTRSPFTAYQAITAIFGDVTQPLRRDVADGSANIDRELVLKGEAAGGLAAAHTAEADTEDYDREARRLAAALAADGSPGRAAQVAAHSNLMVVRQQSYVMRLLARVVRLQSVEAALAYGSRMEGRNAAAAQRGEPGRFVAQALKPPALIRFDP